MAAVEQIDILFGGRRALTLSGRMAAYSTPDLHVHDCHQVLTVTDGVTLLVDRTRKQPLFGHMAAFLPAGLPHHSLVIGEKAKYRSLYLAPELFPAGPEGIVIFCISELGAALFNRIQIRKRSDLGLNLNQECLDLFLKIMAQDLKTPADLVRLPVPGEDATRRAVRFMEDHYARRVTMAEIAQAAACSQRHLARRFKADLNLTVFAYLRLQRVLEASVALGTSSKPMVQIAYESGYEAVSSFYHDFKIVFGLAPKAFQRRLATPNRILGGTAGKSCEKVN